MKTHKITIEVVAPNKLPPPRVRDLVTKLIAVGRHDAQLTSDDPDLDHTESDAALSLRFKGIG